MPSPIANTSPLQYLFQTGLLDLMPKLYAEVLIPSAVQQEIDRGRALGVSLPTLSDFDWTKIVEPTVDVLLPLANGLGSGELAVIAIAKTTPDALALLDDRRARRCADLLAVPYIGTLGILLSAKSRGLLDRVEPVCDALDRCGFRMNSQTRRAVLSLAQE
jgi:predicted nucleic acid-binding protein